MMKLYTHSLLILLSIFGTIGLNAQTHLQSYQYVGHYTKANVQTILNNFGVPQNLVKPEFEVDVYKVIYRTRNAQDTGNTTASGVIAIPSNVSCPLPLLAYAHGTTSRRYDVPSYGSSERNIGIIMSSAQGYVAALPDYLGLGDSPGFHPYVHAKSEASATRDLLRVARELSDTLNYNLNGQVFLCGYSQGGHAAMATFKELELYHNTEFTVTAAAPMSGPYDISGAQSQYLTADAPYSSPGYLPYVVMGYQEAYGNLYNSLSEVFKAPYDSLLPIYFDGTRSMGYIDSRLPDTPKHMLNDAFLQDFINNPNNIGRWALADNNLHNWTPTAPLHMFYCNGDEQVTYLNAIVAYDTMTALGAQNVFKTDYGNRTHGDCVQYALLGGLSFFNTYKDLLGGMQINANVNQVSGTGAADGSITMAPSNGVPNYSYQWLGVLAGQTSATVSGLNPGNYVVRVADSRGCFANHTVNVGTVSSIQEIAATDVFKLYPNPADQVVFLQFEEHTIGQSFEVIFRDLYGRVIHQVSNYSSPLIRYDIGHLPTGVYLIEVSQGTKRYVQKLVVNP